MFEKFCFCYKHRTSAIMMAVMTLIVGIVGTISFGVRIQYKSQRTDGDYLIFSVFHIVISLVLTSAIIWEKPVLIFAYLIIHISIVAAFLTHTIIYVSIGKLFWCQAIILCFLFYCMYCTYLYYIQLKLKRKSNVEERFVDAVYYINNNTLY